jgi:hypothetical protein
MAQNDPVPSLCSFAPPDLVALLEQVLLGMLPGVPPIPPIPTIDDLLDLIPTPSCPID